MSPSIHLVFWVVWIISNGLLSCGPYCRTAPVGKEVFGLGSSPSVLPWNCIQMFCCRRFISYGNISRKSHAFFLMNVSPSSFCSVNPRWWKFTERVLKMWGLWEYDMNSTLPPPSPPTPFYFWITSSHINLLHCAFQVFFFLFSCASMCTMMHSSCQSAWISLSISPRPSPLDVT